MTEIWKDIEGYDHKYQVSNLGRVRSIEHKDKLGRIHKCVIMKPQEINNGYLKIRTKTKDILVHRAVAKAFVSGYFDGAEVNHKDENKHNNRWDNLEWVSHSENMAYGSCQNKMRETSRERRGISIEVHSKEGITKTYKSIREASIETGVSRNSIKRTMNTDRTAKGYRFKTPSTPITNRTTNPITNRTDNPIDNRVPTPSGGL